ncbi:amino acid kinase family protein [Burkholderia cenocepacia]|uniref:acetylglutamate kinase n=1 Tax=Burkholderia cenocepacia TaxID=95486 RepID=UPI000F679773|nr:acetylglutamate kinase [Burkholderia cenocepacia]RSB89240.1 acetylglutamate kinase [Burkholderia cenocepacia]
MFPDPDTPTRRVAGLARSLPFMQALHGQTVVIIDGGAASDAHTRSAFAQDVALLALTGIHPIVIQSIPTASVAQSVHATHAAMAGVNHELVRLIGSHGARAIGVDGHDGGLLVARAGSGHANTSEVARFDVTALNAFVDNGLVPVVMPIAPDDAGHDRLLRPERLGSLFAQRTGAVTLVMMVDSAWLRELGELTGLYGITELEQWLAEHPAANAAPCVRDALDALAHGVQNAHLADIGQPESLIDELLAEEGSGVVFCRRGNTDLLSETRRYFADSACVLRDGFSVEQKPVVRF